MDYNSILSQIVEEQNGYLRIVDVQNKDFSKYTVMEYIKKNEMEKVASGVYLAPDAWEDKLYSLQIRNRKQMDIQIFQSAITTYFSDKKKDIHKLMEYAKIMKLEERVRQYTEVLL